MSPEFGFFRSLYTQSSQYKPSKLACGSLFQALAASIISQAFSTVLKPGLKLDTLINQYFDAFPSARLRGQQGLKAPSAQLKQLFSAEQNFLNQLAFTLYQLTLQSRFLLEDAPRVFFPSAMHSDTYCVQQNAFLAVAKTTETQVVSHVTSGHATLPAVEVYRGGDETATVLELFADDTGFSSSVYFAEMFRTGVERPEFPYEQPTQTTAFLKHLVDLKTNFEARYREVHQRLHDQYGSGTIDDAALVKLYTEHSLPMRTEMSRAESTSPLLHSVALLACFDPEIEASVLVPHASLSL